MLLYTGMTFAKLIQKPVSPARMSNFERKRRLRAALLFYAGGFGLREIGRVCGISHPTVKVWIEQALELSGEDGDALRAIKERSKHKHRSA
jgi:transposase-like protein